MIFLKLCTEMKTLVCTVIYTALLILSAYSQNNSGLLSRPYTSNLKYGTVKQFLDEVQERSGTIIEYSNNLELEKMVRLDINTLSIGDLLQEVLKGQQVKLIEKHNKIILAVVLNKTDNKQLPLYTFFGFVKEELSLEPLIDATIIEPSTKRGNVTNAHGYFSILLPEGTHHLEISYAGFETIVLDIDIHAKDM